jgi:hypothetical protein
MQNDDNEMLLPYNEDGDLNEGEDYPDDFYDEEYDEDEELPAFDWSDCDVEDDYYEDESSATDL